MKTLVALALTAGWSLLLAGCITHESTVTRDVERTPVAFENEAAARIFYEALSHSNGSTKKSDSTSKFEIPVVFEYKRHVVTGSNGAFNQAVQACDTNKDGKITELEAKVFAEQRAK